MAIEPAHKLASALVVGGHADSTRNNLAPKLREFGIHMVGHWPYKENNAGRPIPAKADVVLILTDSTTHADSERASAEARRDKLPLLLGTFTWSHLEPRLRKAGFAPVPPEVVEAAYGPVDGNRRARAAEVKPPQETAPPPLPPAAATAPSPPPPTAPPVPGAPPAAHPPSPEVLRAFQQAVCESPAARSDALRGRALELLRATYPHAERRQWNEHIPEARTRCGVSANWMVHSPTPLTLDRARYEAACRELGIAPTYPSHTAPTAIGVRQRPAIEPTPSPGAPPPAPAAAESAGRTMGARELLQRLSAPPEFLRPSTEAPAPALTPPAVPNLGAPAPTPRPRQATFPEDVQDALGLLRGYAHEHGFVGVLTIDLDTGKVRGKQRVTVDVEGEIL